MYHRSIRRALRRERFSRRSFFLSEQNFRAIGATTFLSPVPAVVLSCRGSEPGHERPNLITVA